MIKGILFDYGGTLDTHGIHWANVIWENYQKHGINISKELFGEAYVYGERTLAIQPLVKPEHNFYDVLVLKTTQQFIFLKSKGVDLDETLIEKIAQSCNDFAKGKVVEAIPLLERLTTQYPLVMVSNFYGNLSTVLTDFGIKKYFDHIVESAVVGVRKPDAAIYQLGVEAIGLSHQECLVVGDSYSKDIIPASSIGCHTVWINGIGWNDTPAQNVSIATYEISNLAELDQIINKITM